MAYSAPGPALGVGDTAVATTVPVPALAELRDQQETGGPPSGCLVWFPMVSIPLKGTVMAFEKDQGIGGAVVPGGGFLF